MWKSENFQNILDKNNLRFKIITHLDTSGKRFAVMAFISLTFTLLAKAPVNGHFCLSRDQTGQHFSTEIKWHKERRGNQEHNWRRPALCCVISFFKLGHWEGGSLGPRGQEVIVMNTRRIALLLQVSTWPLLVDTRQVPFFLSGCKRLKVNLWPGLRWLNVQWMQKIQKFEYTLFKCMF